MHFSDRLKQRMDDRDSRLVIGIDPDPARLLAERSPFRMAHPDMLDEGLLDAFCDSVIGAARETACAVKPQSAFFEAMGIAGLRSLARCMKTARSHGLPVILDAKRGDIGSTAAAYASAYLDRSSELFADALTVNPFLGPDTLEPFVAAAKRSGTGLFVLVKTSNPGSGTFQDARLSDGRPLFMEVAVAVRRLGEKSVGECGYSDVGAVVGATYPEEMSELRAALPASIFLVPGYGAQGGTADDVRGAFNRDGYGAIISSSRAIIFAYDKPGGDEEAVAGPDAVREAMLLAAQKAREDVRRVTPST